MHDVSIIHALSSVLMGCAFSSPPRTPASPHTPKVNGGGGGNKQSQQCLLWTVSERAPVNGFSIYVLTCAQH